MKTSPLCTRFLVALTMLCFYAPKAYTLDFFFNQTNNGDFAVAANWQGGNLPSGFGNTFIGSSDLGSPTLVPVTVYLNSDVTSLQTGRLFLGQGGSGNATLIISNGGSLQYGEVYIGRDAAAMGVVNQLGGTNRVNTGTFEILSGSSGTGTYNLSGGVLNTIQAGAIAIKVGAFGAGTGYFNMSGGTLNAGSDFATQQHSLNVGWESKGEATFSGGTANITGDLNAGNNGNGLVTISDSATVNARNLNVGLQAGGTNSRLTVSGGTVSVTNGISVANSSILNIGGGTVTATGIGIAAGSVMTNIGGTLNIPAITNNGTLTFNRGNTLSFSGALSGAGTNRIDGGTLTLTASNSFTGAVAVNAGVLNLNSSSGSAAGSVSGITVASNATLLLSQSGQVNDNAAITLSGGTISRASGVNEVFGNLNLAGASALDFGSGTAGSLQFGTYTRDTGSALLTVQNFFQGNSLVFSQNLIAAGYIDASSSGSYSNGYFAFADGFTTSWNGTDTFTITAIPEPSTLLAASALLAVFLWPLGRRWRRQFAGRLR